MPERKLWTADEDKVLRQLRQARLIKKWSVIAEIMETEFQIKDRTGKQCRERYHNHLDSKIVVSEWTEEEDFLMNQLHEDVGNKWSIIAQKLMGRSQNCIKNHFYSKLRKAIRKLNRKIVELYEEQFNQIKTQLLYKIIEITEERFKNNTKLSENLIERCLQIKNKLFNYDSKDQLKMSSQHNENLNQLDQSIRKCSKSFKIKVSDHENQKVEETKSKSGQFQKIQNCHQFYQIFQKVCYEIAFKSE